MESLPQLSNESFSHNWLINITPADSRHSSFDTQDGGSFIDIDPDIFSMRYAYGLDFTLPSSQSSVLVPAEDIFSGGIILPLQDITPPKAEAAAVSSLPTLSRSLSLDSSETLRSLSSLAFRTAKSTPFSLSSCSQKSTPSRSLKLKVPFSGSNMKSPKKIIQKYLFFLTPLYKKVKSLKSGASSSSSKFSRRAESSTFTSPRTSDALSSNEWCRGSSMFDMGAENKIYDAILHCKKSISSSMA